MGNKLLSYLAAFCMLIVQLVGLSGGTWTLMKPIARALRDRPYSRTALSLSQQIAGEGATTESGKSLPLQVDVISFAMLDTLPEYIPACSGCKAITVVFSVTCATYATCEGLSVMDFYVTYESGYPLLFYGDESPIPSLQGPEHAGIIYGAQEEFPETFLLAGERTIGELIFTVKPDAADFVLHCRWSGLDVDVPMELTEDAPRVGQDIRLGSIIDRFLIP